MRSRDLLGAAAVATTVAIMVAACGGPQQSSTAVAPPSTATAGAVAMRRCLEEAPAIGRPNGNLDGILQGDLYIRVDEETGRFEEYYSYDPAIGSNVLLIADHDERARAATIALVPGSPEDLRRAHLAGCVGRANAAMGMVLGGGNGQ